MIELSVKEQFLLMILVYGGALLIALVAYWFVCRFINWDIANTERRNEKKKKE